VTKNGIENTGSETKLHLNTWGLGSVNEEGIRSDYIKISFLVFISFIWVTYLNLGKVKTAKADQTLQKGRKQKYSFKQFTEFSLSNCFRFASSTITWTMLSSSVGAKSAEMFDEDFFQQSPWEVLFQLSPRRK
jgi:hypothetical protein